MNSKFTAVVLGSTLFLSLGLAGCASPAAPAPSDAGTSDSQPTEETPTAEAAELSTADSSLGEIVVDGEGLTVYKFDMDTQGTDTSACVGPCVTQWPAVTTDSETPEVDGLTGEVGTIAGADGTTQVTLDGWPLYYFAGDEVAGDTNGQGVKGAWWVLSPAGEPIAQ